MTWEGLPSKTCFAITLVLGNCPTDEVSTAEQLVAEPDLLEIGIQIGNSPIPAKSTQHFLGAIGVVKPKPNGRVKSVVFILTELMPDRPAIGALDIYQSIVRQISGGRRDVRDTKSGVVSDISGWLVWEDRVHDTPISSTESVFFSTAL
jgi:hypothetical protein